jgi:hypothetical protein
MSIRNVMARFWRDHDGSRAELLRVSETFALGDADEEVWRETSEMRRFGWCTRQGSNLQPSAPEARRISVTLEYSTIWRAGAIDWRSETAGRRHFVQRRTHHGIHGPFGVSDSCPEIGVSGQQLCRE